MSRFSDTLAKLNSLLCESQHGDLAAKVLKKHGIPFEGRADKLVNKIASMHGIPHALVPQVLDHVSKDMAESDHFFDQGTEYRKALGADLSNYTRPDSSVESAADRVKEWHSIATHHHGAHAVMRGNHELVGSPEGISSSAGRQFLEQKHKGLEELAKDHGAFAHNAAHLVVAARIKKYDPMRSSTWRPHGVQDIEEDTTYKALLHYKVVGSGKEYANAGVHAVSTHNSVRTVLENAKKLLDAHSGIKPPYAASHEHTSSAGEHFKAYILDTPDKANDACWGNRFCISTRGHAESMNKMYHGGEYKPTHIITKVTKGEDGTPVERVHAAYLPELLPGQRHADPEQAVRNSGNNGAIHGVDFDKIHPLLSKLDKRIDATDKRGVLNHVYYKHGTQAHAEGSYEHMAPEAAARHRADDHETLSRLGL